MESRTQALGKEGSLFQIRRKGGGTLADQISLQDRCQAVKRLPFDDFKSTVLNFLKPNVTLMSYVFM